MQPYSLRKNGGYTRTVWTPAGYQTPTWVNVGAAATAYLACSSQHGDFKTATPFSFEKGNYGYLRGFANQNGGTWRINLEGYGCGGDQLTIANGCYASALDPYNKCLGKLYDKVRSDIDLSIDIYQGGQTVKMIKSFYNLIRHPLDTLVDGVRKNVVKGGWRGSTKLVGSKWLEWQYGLRPTVGTIYDLTDQLRGALVEPGGFQLIKARATSRAEDKRVLKTSAWHASVPAKVVSSDSRRCEIALSYTIGNAELNALSQFSSLNPVSFFYENVPFSFVVDWVYDIGGYLRMMETALATGLVFHSGYRTDTRLQKTSVTVDGSFWEYGTLNVANLSGTAERKKLNRMVLHSMPIPQLPSWNPKLGTERLLSTASLLSNLLNLPSKRR